jgi:hypothetical protein
MDKDILIAARLAKSMADRSNRSVAGEMLRVFVEKYMTDTDLCDLFCSVELPVEPTTKLHTVVIEGLAVDYEYRKINAIKALRNAVGCGLKEAKETIEMGERGPVYVYMTNPRHADTLVQELCDSGFRAYTQ